MGRVIKVGMIGFGMSGRIFQYPVIKSVPGLKLVKVLEPKGVSDEVMKSYPDILFSTDMEDFLDDSEIEIVVVAVPTPLHYEVTRKVLLSGKHVVVEKPFTVTEEEGQKLIELAESRGLLISIYHNRRWDGDFQTILKIVHSSILGRLVEYEAHFDRYRNYLIPGFWRDGDLPGAGILYDLGSHLIDQVLYLFGKPKTVYADLRTQRENACTVDSFELIIGYENLKAILKGSLLVREQGPRFILHGTDGSFVKYGFDPQEDALKNGLPVLGTNWGVEPEKQWGMLNTQINGLHYLGTVETMPGCYQTYYKNIYQALTSGVELIVKPEQALNVIRTIELSKRSNELMKTMEF